MTAVAHPTVVIRPLEVPSPSTEAGSSVGHASPTSLRCTTAGPCRPVWQPDNASLNCLICKRVFGLVLRRHHCRKCGNIFCNACTKERKVLHQSLGYGNEPQRVCRSCSEADELLLSLQFREQTERLKITMQCAQQWQIPALQMLTAAMAAKGGSEALPSAPTSTKSGGGIGAALREGFMGMTRKDSIASLGDNVGNYRESPYSPSLGNTSMRFGMGNGRDACTPSPIPSPVWCQPNIELQEALADAVLVRAAVFFVDVVTAPANELVKDIRVKLKLHRGVFDSEELAAFSASKYPSVNVSALLLLLRRVGLVDTVDPANAACQVYRVDEIVMWKFRDALRPLAAPLHGIGSVVVVGELGGAGATPGTEAVVLRAVEPDRSTPEKKRAAVAAKVEGLRPASWIVASAEGAEQEYFDAEVQLSPFAAVAASIPVYICGEVKDLDARSVSLGQVRPDFIRVALLFAKHVKANLLGENALSLKTHAETFAGTAATDYLTKTYHMSHDDAIDLGEVFRCMGLFEEVPRNDRCFDGSYQLFRLSAHVMKALESALEHVAKPFSRTIKKEGTTVVVTASGGFQDKEGSVQDMLVGRDGGMFVRVQFPTGESWAFRAGDVMDSPAAELLLDFEQDERNGAARDYPLSYPAVRNLALLFVEHVTKLVGSKWLGVTRYRNVFLSDDALAWLTKFFPTVPESHALALCQVLRKSELFVTAESNPAHIPAAFDRKQAYRFSETVLRTLDAYVVEEACAQGEGKSVSAMVQAILKQSSVCVPGAVDGDAQAEGTGNGNGFRNSTPLVTTLANDASFATSVTSLPSYSMSQKTNRPRTVSVVASPLGGVAADAAAQQFREIHDAVLSSLFLRRMDRNRWALQRVVLTNDGMLEIHAPNARISAALRLRRVASSDSDALIEPAVHVEQGEVVTLVNPTAIDGHHLVRVRNVEGYVPAEHVSPTPALKSSLKAAEVSFELTNAHMPTGREYEEYEQGLIMYSPLAKQFLCSVTEAEAERWAQALSGSHG